MAIIGIDLGTTNSLVAVWQNGEAKLIKNKLGSELTPSVVSVDQGKILVGQHAKERLVTHPNLTVAGFKRYMGTNKVYQLGDHSFSPEELSAFVIAKLKEDAESYLGEKVEEAIISVPAYFNNDQRYATKMAAKLAGVSCNRIINEPSAAALSCRMQDMESDRLVLVFDFGGGTLDVSIVECFENIIEIQAIAGDNHLGGRDFDELIAQKFCAENGIDYSLLTEEQRGALLRRAELGKIELSQADYSTICFRYEEKEYQFALTNEILVEIAGNLLLKMKQIIGKALKDSGRRPADITDILPVGGSCEMPVVRDYLSHLFRKPIGNLMSGDKIVATGLGIYCGIKMRSEDIKDVIMTDVCPFSLGTDIRNPADPCRPLMSVIIERNTVLPVKSSDVYVTSSDAPYFSIYQGESTYVDENVKIGGIGLDDLPEELKYKRNSIGLTFSYDINGILGVTATVLSTGQEKSISIATSQNSLSEEQMDERRRQMERLPFADEEENHELIALAARIYAESVGEIRDTAERIFYQFQSVLKTNSPIKIKKAREELLPILHKMDAYVNRDVFEMEELEFLGED